MTIHRLIRPVAGALTGTGLVAAAVLGVQQTHDQSDPSLTASTSGSEAAHVSCRPAALRGTGKLPDAMKKDLAAARAKIKDGDATGKAKRAERRQALVTIRKAAKAGKYGDEVQQRLAKREARVEKHRAQLPDKLVADLAAVQKMAPGKDRRAAAAKIREGRLDGTYGATVKAAAEKAEKRQAERKQTCQQRRAAHAENG